MDRKVDLIVNELRKFSISVTGISETKWFGQEVHSVSNFTILHSGHPRPEQSERFECGEGVDIVLNLQMTDAWRAESVYNKYPVFITIFNVPAHRSP